MYVSEDCGAVYVREKGELRYVSADRMMLRSTDSSPKILLSTLHRHFTIREPHKARRDHFIFTYNKEGSLRYTVKSLFDISYSSSLIISSMWTRWVSPSKWLISCSRRWRETQIHWASYCAQGTAGLLWGLWRTSAEIPVFEKQVRSKHNIMAVCLIRHPKY